MTSKDAHLQLNGSADPFQSTDSFCKHCAVTLPTFFSISSLFSLCKASIKVGSPSLSGGGEGNQEDVSVIDTDSSSHICLPEARHMC